MLFQVRGFPEVFSLTTEMGELIVPLRFKIVAARLNSKDLIGNEVAKAVTGTGRRADLDHFSPARVVHDGAR